MISGPRTNWLFCGIAVLATITGAALTPQTLQAQETASDGSAASSDESAAPTDAPDATAPQQIVVPSQSSGGQAFPPYPQPFFRGNQSPTGSTSVIPTSGFYFSTFRVLLYLGLIAFWVWASSWVNEDSDALKVRNGFWNLLMMAGGASGLLLALCLPSFFVAFLLVAVSSGTPLGLYIKERNDRVPENARVLTPDHIRAVTFRTLARLGIRLGGNDGPADFLGPDIQFLGKTSTGKVDTARTKSVENSRGYMAAKELVYDALIRRATDIHLEPSEDAMNVRMRIDGVMYPAEPFDRALGDAVINIFKVLSAMDITEKRRSLDGSFRAITEGREIDFRVATQGTRGGEKMSIRILDQSASVASIKDLGFRKALEDKLTQIVHQPHGMLLVCGPTGAGKSTTLYACLNAIDSYQHNIITIEDPVEYRMDRVTQIEINQKSGQTFASGLRSVLRQDPDVIMIGEIRDGETANIACQASNTGHMVFSTVHANDSITALYRMIDLGIEPFMFASSVSAILAQRLARRLCPKCKEAYRPKAEFLKQANLPADRIEKFYRPPKNPEQECPACGGLGYRGRVGVFEFLEINDRMRDMIRDKAALSQLKSEARKNGMLYMQEEGLRLVVKGTTSIEELLRVVK
ncbi:type II/IV secretion system protein [bacterium]|nr:type II/IV secretion system protein [bacterium]